MLLTDTWPLSSSFTESPSGTQAGGSPLDACPPKAPTSLFTQYNWHKYLCQGKDKQGQLSIANIKPGAWKHTLRFQLFCVNIDIKQNRNILCCVEIWFFYWNS